MKNPHIKKKNGEKKPHTNQKKIREKPILLKKKKLNNNNTYEQINRTGNSNNRTCLSILALFQPNTNRKIIL